MVYEVSMFERSRLIEVRVRAKSMRDATRKAEDLCPDAVHLSTRPSTRWSGAEPIASRKAPVAS